MDVKYIMKECCLDIWYETNVVIRMITWEHVREEKMDGYSQEDMFPISYTCPSCGRKWSNKKGILAYVGGLMLVQ